eukprot:CAMPEP_0201549116 /NCGR_PEP_ID=MMETSP0173_2-20130828/5605_1 /ASSEMBLY_ACC=CAM_ASM_000268 /TAXON_ID=218659 /ORGANISM="Vexillifera sp., Strain DIVA3 564/2" /LENGTH=445 /DNA_ID=CAMNT_0047958681 /DNA_START=230 /DNA_END=1567 /DNA_ORIENTATION=+
MTEKRMIANWAYKAQKPSHLTFEKGDVIIVTRESASGWWKGHLEGDERVGRFPANYTKEVEKKKKKTVVASMAISPEMLKTGGEIKSSKGGSKTSISRKNSKSLKRSKSKESTKDSKKDLTTTKDSKKGSKKDLTTTKDSTKDSTKESKKDLTKDLTTTKESKNIIKKTTFQFPHKPESSTFVCLSIDEKEQKQQRVEVESSSEPEALAPLGVMFKYGYGGLCDESKARELLERAIDKNDQDHVSMCELATLLEKSGDYKHARDLYTESAELLNEKAEHNLAYMTMHGIGGDKDEHGALDLYKKAAHQGYIPSMYAVGCVLAKRAHDTQLGDASLVRSATKWLRKAADQGMVLAQHHLACFLAQNYLLCPKSIEGGADEIRAAFERAQKSMEKCGDQVGASTALISLAMFEYQVDPEEIGVEIAKELLALIKDTDDRAAQLYEKL